MGVPWGRRQCHWRGTRRVGHEGHATGGGSGPCYRGGDQGHETLPVALPEMHAIPTPPRARPAKAHELHSAGMNYVRAHYSTRCNGGGRRERCASWRCVHVYRVVIARQVVLPVFRELLQPSRAFLWGIICCIIWCRDTVGLQPVRAAGSQKADLYDVGNQCE